MIEHIYNTSTQRRKQKDKKFSLGYMRPGLYRQINSILQNKKPQVCSGSYSEQTVAHTSKPEPGNAASGDRKNGEKPKAGRGNDFRGISENTGIVEY